MARIPLNKIITANALKNNGASVVYGTTRGNVVTSAPGRTFVARSQVMYHYTPPLFTTGDSDDYNARSFKAVSASNAFGTMTRGQYLILGTARSIGGVATSTLLFASKMTRIRTIHFSESRRSLQTYGKVLNLYTGRFTTVIASQLDQYAPLGGNSRDHAARPTAYVTPGEFVVKYGTRSDPQYQDYRAKTD